MLPELLVRLIDVNRFKRDRFGFSGTRFQALPVVSVDEQLSAIISIEIRAKKPIQNITRCLINIIMCIIKAVLVTGLVDE